MQWRFPIVDPRYHVETEGSASPSRSPLAMWPVPAAGPIPDPVENNEDFVPVPEIPVLDVEFPDS
jgi:hypothetical protein